METNPDLENKINLTHDKVNDLYTLLTHPQVGAMVAIQKLNKTVYGNGERGLCEELRDVKKDSLRKSTLASIATSLAVVLVAAYVKHQMGW